MENASCERGLLPGQGGAGGRGPHQARQQLLLLRLGAKLVDGVHHQAALHGHGGAVAAVHALHLARHQAVRGVARAHAAVALHRGAQQAQRAHLLHDGGVEALVAEGRLYARQQRALAVRRGGVADHALLLGELSVQLQRVAKVERRQRGKAARVAGGPRKQR